MTVSQASIVPITNNETIETITLKNIVALDTVERNEALLKLFRLFDDSQIKRTLKDSSLSIDTLKQLIKEKKTEEVQQLEDLSNYKTSLLDDPNLVEESELLKKLSAEFLSDEIPKDDTDELIQKFESSNNVKVVFDKNNTNYSKIEGNYLLEHNGFLIQSQESESTVQETEKGEQAVDTLSA